MAKAVADRRVVIGNKNPDLVFSSHTCSRKTTAQGHFPRADNSLSMLIHYLRGLQP
jgi:hypothetical protein